jgi:hypothetical protein
MKDDAQGLASQLAYYFFLSLFPALLFLIALASLFPLQHFTDDVVRVLGPVAPAEFVTIIQQEMIKLGESRDGGLISLGLIGALWSSSSAMGAVVNAMNRAYDIEDSRPWWKVPSHRRRAHGRSGAVHSDLVHADRRGAGNRRKPREALAPRPGVRVDLDDRAVADRLHAGGGRHRSRLLLRA